MINRTRFSKTIFFKLFFFLSLTLIIFNSQLFAEGEDSANPNRYSVFSLKHISAKQGKAVLEELGIGTVSHLPNSNTLLVTAPAEDLNKAGSILELIDSQDKYIIEIIGSAAEAAELPTNEQIEKALGADISVGTFDDPSSPLVSEKILIDIHNGMVLAFVRERFSGNVLDVFERFSSAKETTDTTAEPNIGPLASETTEVNENDEFFKNLLDSLDEAEQKASELQLAQPSLPTIKNKIARFQKDHAHSAVPRPEPEDKADVNQPAPDNQALESLLSKISETSLVDEPMKAALEADGKEKEPKSGVIEIRDRKSEPKIAEVRVDENLYRPELPETMKEEVKIDLPSKLNITDLLTLVGEYLELDFMYDPKNVKGEVMLKFRGPIRVRDLYPLMESVLRFNGFVMTRKESLVTIVPVAEALTYDPEIYSAPGSVKVGDVIITRIFGLEHIDTSSAKNLLGRMKLGASIEEIPATKTLIVTEYAYRMPRIEELIKMVDQPGEPKKFRYRRLEYTLAQSLVDQVKDLADKLGTVSISIGAAKQPQPKQPVRRGRAPQQQQQAAAEPEIDLSETVERGVYLVADERTNRILMIGLDEDLNIVEDIITALDVEKEDLRTLRLYEIRNVGAGDVANKLYDLGIISVLPSSTGGRTGTRTGRGRITAAPRQAPQRPGTPAQQQPQTTDAASVEEILTGEPQIVIIESTNSLLVNATSEQHAQIALIIGYVDSETERASIPYVVYPLENQDPAELAQILTQLITETTQTQDQEGKIVSSTTTKLLEDDIVIIPDPATYSLIVYASKKNQQWIGNIIRQLDEYRAQVLLDVTLVAITKDDDFQFSLDLLTKYPTISTVDEIVGGDPVALGGRFWEASSTSGSGEFFYNDDHVQALLKAVKNRKWGRILSRPKLLVNDNQEGQIIQNRTIYITETDVTTVATTTTPTTSTDVKFTPYQTGIDLKIKPHISKGNQLRLEITLQRDDFDGEPTEVTVGQNLTVQKPADERSNQITSVVTVPDGYTVILGGIETLSQQKAGSKVPILGDIPLIGGLFNSINNIDTQSRLYIFVKAHILRPSETVDDSTDIVRVSRRNQAEFEELEQQFQEAHDWPGIKPEPLDPVKVLEEQDL